MFAFCLGGVYDVVPSASFLRIVTPLRYFNYKDALSGEISLLFLALSLILIVSSLLFANVSFSKRDFSGV